MCSYKLVKEDIFGCYKYLQSNMNRRVEIMGQIDEYYNDREYSSLTMVFCYLTSCLGKVVIIDGEYTTDNDDVFKMIDMYKNKIVK